MGRERHNHIKIVNTKVMLMACLGLLTACTQPVSSVDTTNTASVEAPDKDTQSYEQRQLLMQTVGKLVFKDASLSEPAGQSCQSCHQPENAYSSPNEVISPGANPQLFGNRNTPSISYVKYNPVLHWDFEEKHWVGGFFYDGRASNLKQQAIQPMINELEMGNQSMTQVVAKVKKAPYSNLMEQLFGAEVWQDEEAAIDAIAAVLVAYETGPEFSPFTSKYDYYLAGKVELTPLEKQGLEVFEAENKGNCAACHISQPNERGVPPIFTDFTYDNLGLAYFADLPFLTMDLQYNPDGKKYVDLGLGTNPLIHNAEEEVGKFKVPTLRNIAITGPYMHNGMFDNLTQVVDFYNSRDVAAHWGKPEIKQNLNTDELGDLKLSEPEVEALVAFMKTLTDGYEL